MTKKKHLEEDDEEGGIGAVHYYVEAPPPEPDEPPPQEIAAVPLPPPRRSVLPALSVGDLIALLTLIVLSAVLLLEGYHKDFRDYSKEIIALFAIVVGFLLGRKT